MEIRVHFVPTQMRSWLSIFAAKFYAITYEGQKLFFSQIYPCYESKKAPYMTDDRAQICYAKYWKTEELLPKKTSKNGKMAKSGIFQRFSGHNSHIFNILENGFFAWSLVIKDATFDIQYRYIWKKDFLLLQVIP